MKNRLLVTTAICGLAFISTSPAFALCAPAPSNGGTVTCSTNDVTGVAGIGNTGLTINVDPAVSVTTAGDTLSLGNGTVNIGANATIESTGAIAIRTGAGTTNITIGNGADLISSGQGIFYDAGGGTGSVVFGNNTSLTSGSGTSIQFGVARGQLTITDTTTISGTVNTGVAGNDSFTYNDANGSTFDTTRFTDKYFGFEEFTKGGTGATTLSGGEEKNWSITAGRLIASEDTLLNAAISGGAILEFNNVDGTYASNVSGAGTWEINNDSILTISGNNSGFTGTYDIDTNNNVTFADANAVGGASNIGINQSTFTFGSAFNLVNNITIGAQDATIDTGAFNASMTNYITGTGGAQLIKAGSGRLALDGVNDYDGGTIISAGTLYLGNVGSASTGAIANSGTLEVAANGTVTNNISGTGNVVVSGAHATTFSGTNTYSGTTTISGGATLTVNNTARLGDASVTNSIILDNGTLATGNLLNGRAIALGAGNGTLNVANGANTLVQNGVISGAGNLTKTGVGSMTLGGANTYSGTTTFGAGTTSVSAANNLGDGSATNDLVFNGGSLAYTAAFDQTRDVTMTGAGSINTGGFAAGITGNLTGAGTLTKNDTGTLTLTGAHTNSGALVINAGTLALVDASTRTYNGNISGSGNLTLSGTGVLTLGGTNTLSGTTSLSNGQTVSVAGDTNLGNGNLSINQGTLRLAADAYTNNILIGASDATVFANTGDVTLSGNITGATGRLTKTGASNLVLTGTNTFGDGLVINAGRITADSVTALGSGAITNNGELNIDLAAGTETLTNLMSGAGWFQKVGNSTLIVTGNHGMTGDVYATQGTLRVNGSLGSAANTYIIGGARLGGTGTVANVEVQNGGIFAPGNSIGTTNVVGDVDFLAGSHYAVEYTSTPDDSDKIIATGNVVIDNGAILDLTGTNGNFLANTNYILISAASVTGTFGTVNNNLAFLDADFDDSTATDLILTLTRNNTSFADILNEDELDFANAFDDLANDLTTAFTNLTAAEAQAAAATLSNEHQGGVNNFASSINTGVLNTIANRMGHSFDGTVEEVAEATPSNDGTYIAAYLEPQAGSNFDRQVNVWMQAVGGFGRDDSSASDPTNERHSYGALAGVDVPFDDKGIFGFFAGYERGEVETAAQGSSSDVDNYHAGAYAQRPVGDGWMVNGGLALTYHQIDTVRHVVLPGFDASPESDTNGYSASGFVEVSKPMQSGTFKYAPFASFGIGHTSIDGYAEENGGLANLVVDDNSTTNPFTILGMRFETNPHWGDSDIKLYSSLGWQHVFGTVDDETAMRFETGTAQFRSGGAPRARNAALVSFGLDASLMPGMNAFLGYNGNWSGYSKDHGFEAGLTWKF